ncbi:hypothetical protein CIRMBP1310_01696 [Enterococcus cecorum]|uniref:Uncharacterized protein n=1 Tax=Enterococcus cecorum TaxID=44008 RepID=A0AAW8TW68_9ENTE|nr:hypothetical protein [Enterococcus cecorum]MCJ0535934.1 hypothetical protein [Enterococcus cecorum]MCJ0554965.1 hypothetical protein [Enterococcus cecorum]MDT2797402.1 hypothetical protein [Enterococcus cecorum]CAI3479323.1 hypothetical protein CIRMBP1310_01696 [Enterococcus cecorum]CAI3502561.1 hypothetical protein CIRMBP1311_02099 [Enterococcus cecorum]
MYLLYNGNEDDKRAVVAAETKEDFLKKVGEYALKNDEFYLMVDEVVEDDNKELTVINDVDLFKGNKK